MSARDLTKAIDREMEAWDASHEFRLRSRHNSVVLRVAGRERFVTLPLTPSDCRCVKNHIADVRRALRDLGAQKVTA